MADWSMNPTPVLLLAALLLLATPVGAVGSPSAPTAQPSIPGASDLSGDENSTGTLHAPSSSQGPTITIQAKAGTDQESGIRYTVEVSDVDEVGVLWLVTAGAAFEEPTGARVDDESATRLRWDAESSTVRTTLVPTSDPTADGTMRVSGSDWAFGPVPPLQVVWTPEAGGERQKIRPFQDRDTERVQVSTPAGGLVGEKYAVSGPVTVQTVQTDHGVIRLVTPDAVSPRASQTEVRRALGTAARAFDDGGTTGVDLVFVVPAVRRGGATFLRVDETWVAADTRLNTANSVWFHEYVHSRQEFELGPRMRWFEEASAEYFSARLTAEAGYATAVEQELYWLGRTRSESQLTQPSTWGDSPVPYHRGALVLAALDSEIQERTDGQRSLEDVFRYLNQHDGVVTYELFAETVSEVTGEEMEPWLDRYVAGTDPVRGPTTSSTVLTVVQTALPDGSSEPLGLGIGISLLGGIMLRRRPFR